MIKGLYNYIGSFFRKDPRLEENRERYCEEFPSSGDQIKVLCTPIRYIEAGERLLKKMSEKKKGLEGNLT